MEEIFKPTFKVTYSLINDEHNTQNLYCQTRDNFGIISEYCLGNIEDIVSLIKENKQLKAKINKIKKKCGREKGRTDFDVLIKLNEQLKTAEDFVKKIDYNLHPIITEAYKCDIRNSINDLCDAIRHEVVYKDSIKEILNNKEE